MCKRFLNKTNHVQSHALFDLFRKFSDQTGSIVCDNMVGWAFDNYKLLEDVCKIAMEQRKTCLKNWINEMASEQKPGDEIVLYILSKMYRKHTFIYTQMFWWTTLLYSWPVQEKDLMEKCEIVLVYMNPGVFGELDKICLPTAAIPTVETPLNSDPPVVIPQNVEKIGEKPMLTTTDTNVITGDTADITRVSTGSTSDRTETPVPQVPPTPQEGGKLVNLDTKTSSSLPNIDIFMKQRCSIPLIRCDYESAFKAADTHIK